MGEIRELKKEALDLAENEKEFNSNCGFVKAVLDATGLIFLTADQFEPSTIHHHLVDRAEDAMEEMERNYRALLDKLLAQEKEKQVR